MDIDKEIQKIQMKLEDLKKRWPAHSVKAEMVEEKDRLEDELSELERLRLDGFNNMEGERDERKS